ncbi:MAG: DUF2490 domain-containing protein [Phaeodactylibacter xiamenensis]|uniref:DUF2490 domain-containing protein n=1 Tax=Phaeodactylibacter xiamenensis TaxID=1524460 RepID=UPI0006987AB4|nr:DUF2490 domain-containing protein [Phaeodactylibacter xiamenensis]MCR9052393.1 DUF2490 domain-containing protein [bacterium]
MDLRRTIFLFAFFMAALGVNAQKDIAVQYNTWYMYFGNHRLSDQFGLHTEYQWRRHEWVDTWQQSLMRVGLDYYVTENSMLTAGYGWIESFPYGEQPIAATFTEHRIWQQWVINQRVGRFYVNHRYRLEQRFLEQPGTDDYVFRQRARYRLMAILPLGQRELKDHSFFLSAYAEPFISFGKGVDANILGQNRLYLALGYRISPQVNFQLGYLNQYIVKADGQRHERNHDLQVGLTYNLDLRR